MKKYLFLVALYSICSSAQNNKFFDNKSRLRNMTQRWELDTTASRGTFLITPYKPIYMLPFRLTNRANDAPYSGNDLPTYAAPVTDLNNAELKFQISFKTKIFQGLLWNRMDVWGAYTQVAEWQIYNEKLSRPFREINYEPEIILNFPLHFKIFGFNARMAGVAYNHQSNGKGLPYSRSWNRVIFHAGFEREDWSIMLRPWIKLADKKEDNPDISKFIGRGDANIVYTHKDNVFSLLATHNLAIKGKVRGNLTFSWSTPIKGNLKGYLQASHGYGETLIDYNYKQTTIGVGVSLVEWL